MHGHGFTWIINVFAASKKPTGVRSVLLNQKYNQALELELDVSKAKLFTQPIQSVTWQKGGRLSFSSKPNFT